MRAELVEGVEQTLVGQFAVSGPARHGLARHLLERLEREATAGERDTGREVLGPADAEGVPHLPFAADDRAARPDAGQAAPAGAAAFDVVEHADREPGAQEGGERAGPPVRRGLPAGAGHAAAVDQQDRGALPRLGRHEALHGNLLDVVEVFRIVVVPRQRSGQRDGAGGASVRFEQASAEVPARDRRQG
ncbi:hypothetical protein LWP59_26345 [Amycolatopsis acidiphila]|uniref:Uncharacterized protein n=1 Tax=Amycolatopsis acidiphila TaxID=715473 RepID=A0A557ZZT8_9PSEU|nr:hypothetical protein [Amycolatopsis acidiphila]TVT17516.1 hypothetical protein FNH06_31000 [Amycolatopsis acidiphila]UIJ57650.1 hypothetical protein LWP59_26345 [Amycolatopsis acidiphila]GHG95546.1 hypothetical protein GCM10017788_74080 [Amycolatopsis acidiphila]